VNRAAIAGLLLLVCPAGPCVAQDANPAASAPIPASQTGQPLNLQMALDLGDKQNLDLAAARLQRAIASAEIRIAGEIANPAVSFSATRDEPHESIFFDQEVPIGGQRGRRIAMAREEGALTDVEVAAVERQVRRQVREAFYGATLALGMTAERAEALQLAERLRDIAQQRFQSGDVPQLEVIQAELETSRAEAELEVTRAEEKVAWSALDALLNEPVDTEWRLQGSLEDLPGDTQLADLLDRAAQQSPGVQHLTQELKVEQSHESLLRAERVPDLGLELGVDLNSPHDFRAGGRGQLTVGLPLFSRNQGEIAQSEATERELSATLEAARRAISGRVGEAYFELQARRTQVDLYRKTLLPSGRKLEDLAEQSYRAGKSDMLYVLAAQHDVQQLQREYLDSLYALQAAYAELEEIVGAALD
jgi:cobalt-zinc-cadmium efflux system outer membrane protein